MARVKQLDKRSGITYVYDSVSYWDKEKKQPRSKRTLIGRLDPETGEIVPTDGRGQKRKQKEDTLPAGRGPVPVVRTERLFFGATYLLDQIGIVAKLYLLLGGQLQLVFQDLDKLLQLFLFIADRLDIQFVAADGIEIDTAIEAVELLLRKTIKRRNSSTL